MKIIFSMLLSSNSLLLLFIFAEHFIGHVLSQKNKYLILKIALFFSFIPLGNIKALIITAMKYFFPSMSNTLDKSISGRLQTLIITPTGYYINSNYRNNLLMLLVWLAITTIMLIACFQKQYLFRKRIQQTMRETFAPDMLDILKKHTQMLKINKNIRMYTTDLGVTPFTMGLLNPIIVLPNIPDLYKKELIIQHELYHIKKHDSIVKFLQAVVIGIFWFNPLVYLLDSYLNRFCELACDESVASTLSEEDKKKYAYLIVDLASLHNSCKNIFISPFNNSKNTIKERIYLIMKNGTKSRLSIFLTMGMVLFSSIPALAYQNPEVVLFEQQQPSKDSLPLSSNDEVVFKKSNINEASIAHRIIFDEQFTDASGQVYEISPSENGAKIKCQHTYVDGVYEKHTKNKDGSCLTRSYDAQRCSKCGTFILGSLIKETKYTKCPH